MNETIRQRRKWCLQAAESIERKFNLERHQAFDVDKCGRLLDLLLPASRDEDLAYAAEMNAEPVGAPQSPRGPSLIQQLREALGLDEGVSLGGVLQSAIECARIGVKVYQCRDGGGSGWVVAARDEAEAAYLMGVSVVDLRERGGVVTDDALARSVLAEPLGTVCELAVGPATTGGTTP